MKDILDEISIENTHDTNQFLLLAFHTLMIVLGFIATALFGEMVHESIIEIGEIKIHLLGLVIFLIIIFNSNAIAKTYHKRKLASSNIRIALIGGLSVFFGHILLKIVTWIFFYYKGVLYFELIPVLFLSSILFGFGFLSCLSKIKRLRKEAARKINFLLLGYYILFGYFVIHFL